MPSGVGNGTPRKMPNYHAAPKNAPLLPPTLRRRYSVQDLYLAGADEYRAIVEEIKAGRAVIFMRVKEEKVPMDDAWRRH